jgi:hypothetical protein
MNPIIRAVALAVSVSVANVLAAQDDPWQFVQALHFDGNAWFAGDDIRRTLCCTTSVLDRLERATSDTDRRRLAAALVQEGYRFAGFAAATVTVDDAATAATLHVTEGPRCRAGTLRIEGNTEVATDEIANAARQARETWPGWPTCAHFDADTEAAAGAMVQRVYLGHARYGIDADCRFDRHDDVVDLVVKVKSEGRLVRAGRLELVGERPDEVAAVLARVPLPEDKPFTLAVGLDLRSRLEALGRYTRVVLPTATELVEAEAPRVRVKVQVAEFAWPIDKTPWDDIEQLRRGLASLQTHLEAGKEVEVALPVPEAATFAGLTLLPGTVLLGIGKDGVRAHCDALRLPDDTTTSVDLLLGRTAALLDFGGQECGSVEYPRLDNPLTVQVQPDLKGQMELRWGFAIWRTVASASGVDISLHPITPAALLARQDCRRDGDDLVCDLPGSTLRIDRAGQVRCDDTHADAIRWRLPHTTFADRLAAERARFTPAQTQPLASCLLAFAARHGAAMLAALTPAQRDVTALLRSASALPPSPARAAARPEFELAGARPDDVADFVSALAFDAAAALPADSWAALLLRSHRGLRRHDPVAVKRIRAFADAAATGPMALASVAALCNAAGYGSVADHYRQRAFAQWTAAAFFADFRPLVPAGTDLRMLLDRLGAHWRRDTELATVFADLPADADDLAIVERAFARCWDAGLGDCLHAWLALKD